MARTVRRYPRGPRGNRRQDMRLITWNVAKRVSSVGGQAAALTARAADVVALQELTARSWPLWRDEWGAPGYPSSPRSPDPAAPARQPISRRRGGVLLAARGEATA